LGNITYGLDVSLDLSGALGWPAQYGAMSVGGVIYYSEAIKDSMINDELWGGLKVSYSW